MAASTSSTAFLLDLARCIGCQACTAACKTGNELPDGFQYIHLIEQTRGVFPNLQGGFQNHRCYHCADAACVAVCPAGALYKQNGMTRLDRAKCTGCTYCVDACPFDVPVMVDGLASKCDGCAAVTAAGGTPWCVKTCPSHALMVGERSAILAEAQSRVEAIKARYPAARVYGETEAGGLGVIMVLPDDPAVLDLPADPAPPLMVNAWQKVVQPATLGLTGLGIVVTGVAAVIARRNHMQELAELHRAEAQAGAQAEDQVEDHKVKG
jgi:Fe-S-cluster-containing dehydrogenase component